MNRYKITARASYILESEEELEKIRRDLKVKLNEIALFTIGIEKLRQANHKIRLGEFTTDEVIPFASRSEVKRQYKIGDQIYNVRMDSTRYFVFRESLECIVCGLRGTKVYLEKSPLDNVPHFNLYGVEQHKLILITKDHIQAKSEGGRDLHSNFQTCCAICNNIKGSLSIYLEDVRKLRKLYNDHKHLPKKQLATLLKDAKQTFEQPYTNKKEPNLDDLITNLDIRIWIKEGKLISQSVYEKAIEDAEEFSSIKAGTVLNDLVKVDNKFICKINDQECEIQENYIGKYVPKTSP